MHCSKLAYMYMHTLHNYEVDLCVGGFLIIGVGAGELLCMQMMVDMLGRVWTV